MPANVRQWSRNRQIAVGSGTAVALAAVIATSLLWPDGDDVPPPRERQYKATTACLLTDDKALNGDLARAAWAGMQEASTDTRIKVQHLAVTGPQTTANGLTYYNTLGVQKCTVIVAVGDVPVAAVAEGITTFPDVKHVTVGGDPKGRPVTVVDAATSDAVRAGVKSAVAAAA